MIWLNSNKKLTKNEKYFKKVLNDLDSEYISEKALRNILSAKSYFT